MAAQRTKGAARRAFSAPAGIWPTGLVGSCRWATPTRRSLRRASSVLAVILSLATQGRQLPKDDAELTESGLLTPINDLDSGQLAKLRDASSPGQGQRLPGRITRRASAARASGAEH